MTTSAKEDQAIVIAAGKIRAFGRDSEITVPEHARTLDFAGLTALPGLVMLHEHLMFYEHQPAGGFGITHPLHLTYPRLYLALWRHYDSHCRD